MSPLITNLCREENELCPVWHLDLPSSAPSSPISFYILPYRPCPASPLCLCYCPFDEKGRSPYSSYQEHSHPWRPHSNCPSYIMLSFGPFSHNIQQALDLLKISLKPLVYTHIILACLHICSHPTSDAPHGAINFWQAKMMSASA